MVLATSRHQHSGNGDSDRYHAHQRLSSTGGAGLQASVPQNGCTALGQRSCQMLALLERLMNLLTAEQMQILNRTEMKGAGSWGGTKKKMQKQFVKAGRVLGYGLFADERSTNWIKAQNPPKPQQTIRQLKMIFFKSYYRYSMPVSVQTKTRQSSNPKVRSTTFMWVGKKSDIAVTDNKLWERWWRSDLKITQKWSSFVMRSDGSFVCVLMWSD